MAGRRLRALRVISRRRGNEDVVLFFRGVWRERPSFRVAQTVLSRHFVGTKGWTGMEGRKQKSRDCNAKQSVEDTIEVRTRCQPQRPELQRGFRSAVHLRCDVELIFSWRRQKPANEAVSSVKRLSAEVRGPSTKETSA